MAAYLQQLLDLVEPRCVQKCHSVLGHLLFIAHSPCLG